MSAPATDRERLRELAQNAGDLLETAAALDILEWAAEQFGSGFCVASSMADAVVPHLASRALPGVDVIFLDTGYHFAETIGTRDAVAATMPVTIRNIQAPLSVIEQDAAYGIDLFARDPDACCAMRKVAPLAAALAPYTAWAAGLRRDESPSRAHVRVVEWDNARGMVKLNPIARWTQDDVDAYIVEHGVLVNPLIFEGYSSIGCQPCTQRNVDGDARAGRWAGLAKNECGLHTD